MKKRGIYEILSNEKIAKDVYKMILKGDTSDIKYPGQFINIKIDDLIVLQGGGNMGNIYWRNERIRREVISHFPKNLKVVFCVIGKF